MNELVMKYLRWRHSKGYGVHSPYAYRFVTSVLRPGPYRYYSYWEIENHLRGRESQDYHLQNLIKFTIRLAIFLKTKHIISFPETRFAEIAAKSLNLEWIEVNSNNKIKFSQSDLLILEKSRASQSMVQQAIDQGSSVLAINPDEAIRRLLETPMPRGLLLYDKHRILLIPRQEMAYTAYPIKLSLAHR